jgi:iron complex outermembrane receptor protein
MNNINSLVRLPFPVRSTVLSVAALLAADYSLAQETAAAKPETAASKATDTASAKKAAPNTLEAVEIIGTRRSVASAIERKRRAATVSDSIVAEDVDQFPDKNVGEALSRITGVQLTREFGEGSQVSIRGVEPDLNRVEVNGMSVLGTNGGGGRGAELRELASELIASIDVIKGSTADMTEGGIGGTVRITTRKPLDFSKPTLAGTLSGERASSRGGVQPRGSLLLADKFFGGRLGLMANVVYDKVFTRNDYARNTSWNLLRDWDFSAEKTITSVDPAVAAVSTAAACSTSGLTSAQVTDCNRQWYDYAPRISRYGIWTRDHKRSSAELTAQYKVDDDFTIWGSHQSNIQKQTLNDRNYGTDLTAVSRLANAGVAPVYNATTAVQSKAGTCVPVTTTATPAGMVVTNHHVTQYTVGSCVYVAGQGGAGSFSTSARDFKLNIDSKYNSGGFNLKRDALSVEGLLVDSRSNYESESNNIVLTQNVPGLVVTLDEQSVPHFTFPSSISSDDASSYVSAQLQYRPSATFNTEKQAKLDFKYDLGHSLLDQLWFGFQARKSSSVNYGGGGYLASTGADSASTADDVNVLTANVNQTLVYDPLYTGTAQRAADTQSYINSNYSTKYINAAQMQALINAISSRSPGTFFSGYNKVSGLPSSWLTPDYSKATQYFDTSHFNFGNLYQAMGSDGKIYAQIPVFDVTEKVRAAYIRADFETALLGYEISGNFGVRYAGTQQSARGLSSSKLRVESSAGSATYTDRVISNSIVSIDHSYHDFLPSFNAATWLLPNKLVGRLGWAKVMSRPAINLLAPNVTCTLNSGNAQFGGDGRDDCTAGNPELKPYRAVKTDLSLEYYPSRDGQLSLAVFKTDIDTYVLSSRVQYGVDFFGDGNLYDVNQPINGRGAQTRGLELTARTAFTFLPGWLGGFGGEANYTRMGFSYAKGNELLSVMDGSVLPYPGLSKNSYNLSLWYDAGPINARIAYNYRDAFYTGANDVSGNPNFTDKSGYVDAKIQYRFSKQLTVALEGKNLTDQAQVTYSGARNRLNELAFAGRRYFASVSFKY